MKKHIKKLISLTGWELQKSAARQTKPEPSRMEYLLKEAKSLGFNPSLIFDVGANHGSWTSKVLPIYPDAKFVLYEPQPHCGNDLLNTIQGSASSKWRQVAVSNKLGKSKFHVSQWDVTSSLRARDSAEENSIEVEVTTIEQESIKEGRPPDLLKIDAEGYDLEVLEGAQGCFGKIEMVFVEAGVLCDCKNTVAIVLEKMSGFGYGLIGITDLNPLQRPDGTMNEGRLWLVDLVFALKNSLLYKNFSLEHTQEVP